MLVQHEGEKSRTRPLTIGNNSKETELDIEITYQYQT